MGLISSVFFALLSIDKVVTVRESLETWVNFLATCVQRGLSNVEQSCAMRSPSEMDAPSEMFFFLFDTIPEGLLYFSGLVDLIG